MYLFKPFRYYVRIWMFSIYIPLCIYLNIASGVGCIIGFLYLHSTMYLFKHMQKGVFGSDEIHLHSTMYLFKRQPPEITAHRQPHLHSTMYLFKLNINISRKGRYFIYIPLCIYLN